MKRFLRGAAMVLPVLFVGTLVVAACSDDETEGDATTTPDSSTPDVIGSNPETGPTPTPEAGSDVTQPPMDGGTDAPATDSADAAPPPLCMTYPNANADAGADAGPGEMGLKFWELVAFRALDVSYNSCEVGNLFLDLNGPPNLIDCLDIQLREIAGCTNAQGMAVTYTGATDHNGEACVKGAGVAGSSTQLGFLDPTQNTYSNKDVDFLIEEVRKAAVRGGMSTTDAARLKTLIDAKKALASPGGGANYTQSTCEP